MKKISLIVMSCMIACGLFANHSIVKGGEMSPKVEDTVSIDKKIADSQWLSNNSDTLKVALDICFRLLRHFAVLAALRALPRTGISIDARIAMIAITTSSSISVNLAMVGLTWRYAGGVSALREMKWTKEDNVRKQLLFFIVDPFEFGAIQHHLAFTDF